MSEVVAAAELQADKEDLHRHLDQATAVSTRQQTDRAALRVIEGGRSERIAAIEFAAEELRKLELELESAREDLRRLLASLGSTSTTINWRW